MLRHGAYACGNVAQEGSICTRRMLALVVLVVLLVVTGCVALFGYLTQEAMRETSDESRARFGNWITTARVIFGVCPRDRSWRDR